MSVNKNIDDLFKAKLEKRQFQPNESTWEKAEKLIIASEKNILWYTSKLFWTAFSTVGILAIITTAVLLPPGDSEVETVVAASSLDPIERQNHLSVQSTSQQELSGTNQKQAESKVPEDITHVASGDRTAQRVDNKLLLNHTTGIISDRKEAHPEKHTIAIHRSEPASYKITKEDAPLIASNNTKGNTGVLGTDHLDLNMQLMSYRYPYPMPEGSRYHEMVSTEPPATKRWNWLRRSELMVIMGANISQGFVNNGVRRTSPAVGPIAGLKYAYVLNDAVSLGIDVLYNIRSGLNSRLISSNLDSAKSQGLSEWTTSTNNIVNLHYLDVPFYLNLRKKRHTFIIGLQYSQLLAAYGKVTNVTENNTGVVSEESSGDWSGKEAYSSYDLAGMAGYEYVLNERLDIGLRLNYGLYDVTDDQSFGTGVVIDKNLQLRALLGYHLFRY